ncbi:ATP-binding cassette domain-containing protein [Geofilum rubicundum]|uniref:ATP-binding cassette domain-containing protein n=1 Tax=Geofilum rubicundum TaxID=472113 RepID=UPI0034E28BCF
MVGTSGSGKTTLVKMLLGFYPPVEGQIKVGTIDLINFNQAGGEAVVEWLCRTVISFLIP